MTPEERQMIAGLFDRMRSYGTPEKDREADTLINEAVRSTPDASYMLVQSVLVQEHALQEAGNRIKDLEEQVRSLQQREDQPKSSGSGSFLGGLLGGGRPVSQPGASSVPVIGSRAPAPSAFDQDQQRPWSQSAPQQQAAPPAGGGFLRSAMATAAGVAGGLLAAGAIRDLMGGHANANTTAASAEQAKQDREQDARQDASDTEQARQDQEQDALQDASDDDSSWGDDGGGGDMDI